MRTPAPRISAISREEFDARFCRICEITQSRTQAELAKFLDIGQPSVSDAKRRGHIPPEWIIILFLKKRVNPEWILFGQGPRMALPIQNEEDGPMPERLALADCSMDELVAEIARRALRNISGSASALQKELA